MLEPYYSDYGIPLKIIKTETHELTRVFHCKLKQLKLLRRVPRATADISTRTKMQLFLDDSDLADFAIVHRTGGMIKINTPIFRDVAYTAPQIYTGITPTDELVVLDPKKQPHILIAGTTGSGKTTALHSIITLLNYHHPGAHELVLIDLQKNNFERYRKIATLTANKFQDAVDYLHAVIIEIKKRYKDPSLSRHPIFVIIDELADIMLQDKDTIEPLLVQIAQIGREAGVHLVLSTQRPSVDVVTGLLKANIPTRIAFKAATRTDSRVILDQNGAEQLRGNGDALILSQQLPALTRVQFPYIA